MAIDPKSKRALVGGINLHYWDWEGSGPTMVMLHPSSGFGRVWDWLARELHPQYRILALDQRGHGDSDKPRAGYTGEDYAADLEALADQLGLRRFILVGHSLGGRVGMILAARRPERVSHLVLVGGPHYASLFPGEDVQWWRNRAQEIRTAPRRLPSAGAAKEAVAKARPAFSAEALEHVVRYNAHHHPDGSVEWKYDPLVVADGLEHVPDDLTVYVKALACPILMLRASGSWELTAERMPKLEAFFPGARWVTFDANDSHLQLLHPQAMATAIRQFLAEVGEV